MEVGPDPLGVGGEEVALGRLLPHVQHYWPHGRVDSVRLVVHVDVGHVSRVQDVVDILQKRLAFDLPKTKQSQILGGGSNLTSSDVLFPSKMGRKAVDVFQKRLAFDLPKTKQSQILGGGSNLTSSDVLFPSKMGRKAVDVFQKRLAFDLPKTKQSQILGGGSNLTSSDVLFPSKIEKKAHFMWIFDFTFDRILIFLVRIKAKKPSRSSPSSFFGTITTHNPTLLVLLQS